MLLVCFLTNRVNIDKLKKFIDKKFIYPDKMTAFKEPVRIRKKQLANGNQSLYLDIYHNGKRAYEFLKLYLTPKKNKTDKQRNQQTLQLANAIKSQRIVELQNGTHGLSIQAQTEIRFFDYYRGLCEKRLHTESKGNWDNWQACLKHLQRYEPNPDITLSQITPQWIQGFRDYLEHKATAWGCDARKHTHRPPLARNSRHSYFNKLKACLKRAYEEGLITQNPMLRVEKPKPEEVQRMYLTIDEIRTLVDTPCEHTATKNAFLFACLTGLRRSDIARLTWNDVQEQGEFTRLIFRQKKTNRQEYLDIAPQAVPLMGERQSPIKLIFSGLYTPSNTNKVLKRWMATAGIHKHISFHCARHTFAVMMLDLGTDIYTVSKLLGHRDLSTTQIYAKILDKNKQAAVSRIPEIFK